MDAITERINCLIKQKNIKGADLSKAMKVNASTISRILNGTQKPTVDTLFKFSQYFNVSIEYLITGISYCEGATLTPDEYALLTCFRNIPKDGQAELLLLAKMKFNRIENNTTELKEGSKKLGKLSGSTVLNNDNMVG